MADFPIEQALYFREDGESPRLLARSSGFRDDWGAEAEWLLTSFGDRPVGVACPSAVFAHPFGKRHVAVVHVADQDPNGKGYPNALGFHLQIIPLDAYTRFLGDPFAVSDLTPPAWDARDNMRTLTWPAQALPPRTVRDVQRVLQRLKSAVALREDEAIPDEHHAIERTPENSESPALLGGVQVLVDGGRLVFERPAPDLGLMRGLWTLLPASTRAHLWPASFAFGNALHFDALVVPRVSEDAYAGYTSEEQAADYPPGNYELSLQMAAEAGDQRELDALFGRRSWNETWRLGVLLLVMISMVLLFGKILDVPEPVSREPPPARQRQAAIVGGVVSMQHPWNTVGVWLAARDVLNELEKEAQ